MKVESFFWPQRSNLASEVKGLKIRYAGNWPINLHIKFGKVIFISFWTVCIVLPYKFGQTVGQIDGRTVRREVRPKKLSHRGAPLLKIKLFENATYTVLFSLSMTGAHCLDLNDLRHHHLIDWLHCVYQQAPQVCVLNVTTSCKLELN